MSRKHSRSTQTFPGSSSQRRAKPRRRNLTWLWVSLGALSVAVLGIILLIPKATPSVAISPAQADEKLKQGAFFLDVRDQEEWDQFHIAGSTLIPLDQLQNRLNELPKNEEIVVICLSGHRSQSGVTILQQAGFKDVYYLTGGLQAWNGAGYPIQGNAP
jgi:rhodanese-related sulfurtransferase